MASVSSLDKDLKRLRLGKYTSGASSEVVEWICEVLNLPQPANKDLVDFLKDGTVLCSLVNPLLPSPLKPRKSNMPFIQMENIAMFLTAIANAPISLPQSDLFLTVDLYENKDPAQVVQCLNAFSRVAHRLKPSVYTSAIGGRLGSAALSPQNTASVTTPKTPARTPAVFARSATYAPPSPAVKPSALHSPRIPRSETSPSIEQVKKPIHPTPPTPLWNVVQYGGPGGASQGGLGVSFGGVRQITSPGPHVPTLKEKEDSRKKKEEERRKKEEEKERERRILEEDRERREREKEAERHRIEEEKRALRKEEERKKREEEEWIRKRHEEEEKQRRFDEERRREEDRVRQLEEEARRRREEIRREEERLRKEKERLAEIERLAEEERRRKAEESRLSEARQRAAIEREQRILEVQRQREIERQPSPQPTLSEPPNYDSRERDRMRILELERELERARAREAQYQMEKETARRQEVAARRQEAQELAMKPLRTGEKPLLPARTGGRDEKGLLVQNASFERGDLRTHRTGEPIATQLTGARALPRPPQRSQYIRSHLTGEQETLVRHSTGEREIVRIARTSGGTGTDAPRQAPMYSGSRPDSRGAGQTGYVTVNRTGESTRERKREERAANERERMFLQDALERERLQDPDDSGAYITSAGMTSSLSPRALPTPPRRSPQPAQQLTIPASPTSPSRSNQSLQGPPSSPPSGVRKFGGLGMSFLERERERERERQREWEREQMRREGY